MTKHFQQHVHHSPRPAWGGWFFALLIGTLLATGCEDDDVTPPSFRPEINISEPSLYPEGVDYDPTRQTFLVGSFRRGEIGTLDSATGAYARLVNDPQLVSVTGILVDAENNRLYAASADAGLAERSGPDGTTAGTHAYLGVYDLRTGERLRGIDLKSLTPGAGAFPNDLALTPDGSLYLTDSFSPVIYRIETGSFAATVFVNGGEDFTPTPGGFGLNGIVALGNDLLVAKTDDGTLWRVPLTTPTDYTRVIADTLPGVDGLELDAAGNLVAVLNGLTPSAGVVTLRSLDGYLIANVIDRVSSTADAFPTTAALAEDGEVYYLESYLSRTLMGDFSREDFALKRR